MTEIKITRRDALRAIVALAGATNLTLFSQAQAQTSPFKPEKGAKIQLMRWKTFVPSEEASFIALVEAFTKATGVEVKVIIESMEDVQPKASVAASTNQGPDLFWGPHAFPHLFPNKCVDVTDVATYLGKKYGGWVPAAEKYGRSGDRWIAIPVAFVGNIITYRQSMIEKAGFKEIPKDTAGFLELMRGLKARSTPGGFALGRASNDANSWIHWALWSYGAGLVDQNDKVIINSRETVKALEYAKALSETFVAGTASWTDASNNKAFLEGQISLTDNGPSIYAAANAGAAAGNSKYRQVADDMNHALWPVGPVGHPTELHQALPLILMKYSKAPNACKAFMAFLLEAGNYNKWLENAAAFATHPLNAYDANPVWSTDPKLSVFRDIAKRTLTVSGLGSLDEKAAAAFADSVLLDMVASVCTGRASIKDAIAAAERHARRIYR